MDYTKFLNSIASEAEKQNAPVSIDYIGDDGLLYCGKCHTKKQCRIKLFGEEKTVYCLCKCKKEQRDAEEAERKRRERMLNVKQLRESGFPDAEMQNWTFASDDGTNKKITDIAHKYVENFEEMKRRGKGLLFFGNVGTGKTFISACIANALIDKGYPCLVTNFARLVKTEGNYYQGENGYIADRLNKYDLVVIDDLASERDTEYMGEIVQNIIDSRYRAGLPLIITTNLTSDELKRPAEIRKQRIYSRLYEMCIPVEVEGKDRRKQKLRDDYNEIGQMLGLNVAERNENAKTENEKR